MFWTFGTPKEEYKLEMSNLRIIQAYCFIAPDAIHGPEVKAASGELVKKWTISGITPDLLHFKGSLGESYAY